MLARLSSVILYTGISLLAIAGGIVGAFHIAGAKLNPSPSLPLGIYIPSGTPIERGTIVFFRLPPVMREYVATFPGGAELYGRAANGILKPVVGIEGDVICREAATSVFKAAGRNLGVAQQTGPNGAALPVWSGCRRLEHGEIAVGSSRIEDSMDSRFFGPISAAGAAPYRPWVTLPD